jgi:glycosyltransferase involved in cell wall biosynthesis
MTSPKQHLKLSIITPSLNHGCFIKDTILSVQQQNYPNVEHIIIDSCSTDGTIEILKQYNHLIWTSEKDTCQANAINKGIQRSTGDIITWINSDDYYQPNVFASIIEQFSHSQDIGVVYGDISFISKDKHLQQKIIGATINQYYLQKCPDIIRQPSMFFRRSLYEKLEGLREDLNLVFDYDFFLKASKITTFSYIPINISFQRDYGTTKTRSSPRKQLLEILLVMLQNKSLTILGIDFLIKRFFRSYTSIAKMENYLRGKPINKIINKE